MKNPKAARNGLGGMRGTMAARALADTPGNTSKRRSLDRVGDTENGRRVNVAVLWCGTMRSVKVDILKRGTWTCVEEQQCRCW